MRTFSDDVPSADPSNEATATPRSAAVSFGAGSYSVDEGGTVAVTVQLDAAPGREVVVPVSAAGAGGATPPGETGADWSGVPESVTFGATDTEQTFTLAATDDADVDAGESVALSFGTLPAGVTSGTPSEATVTIVDNDVLPTLSVANMAGLESDGVAFTVTLSAAATTDVTVTWTASIETGDTAEAADFGSTTGTVTVVATQTTGTFTVPTAGDPEDTTDEDDETFTVTLSSPSANATLAADATATGTITDNDDPPTISVEDQTVIEGDQDPDDVLGQGSSIIFPFRVTLSAASEKRVRYKVRRVELASDTATDADLQPWVSFRGIQSIIGGTFRYLEGDILRNDDLDEPDETFTLEIYDFENATAGAKTQSTITIQDDDDPPSVSVGDATAAEGAPVEFPVTLSAASGREVAVNWATTDDSATSPADFAEASDTLTFMPGETTATVAVATDRGHPRRARRDLHADPVESVERDPRRGDGDGHDHRQRRPADAGRGGRGGDRGRSGGVHGDAVGGGHGGRDGDLDGVDDRGRRGEGGGRGSRIDDGVGDRPQGRDDGDVHGGDGRGRPRREQRDLHGGAVEPVVERDAGSGCDHRDGHDHRRRRRGRCCISPMRMRTRTPPWSSR